MKYILVILAMITLGCQPNNNNGSPSTIPELAEKVQNDVDAKNKASDITNLHNNQDRDKDNNIAELFRVDFGEKNWVEFTLFQTRARIKGYANEFEHGAEAFLSRNFKEEITNLKGLRDFCHENSYETNNDFTGLPGHLTFTANPLHWAFFQRNASRIIKTPITEVENPFIISRKEIDIVAHFLSGKEKSLILDSGVLGYLDSLDTLRVNLFNSLVGPKESLSSVLARLFCGIADHNASIIYTFYNNKNDVLKVLINSIDF